MKKTILILSLALIFSSVNAQSVKVNSFPKNVDEFLSLRNQIAKTPQGGATMFIIALKMYVENRDLGSQFLVIATDRSKLEAGNVYKNFQLSKYNMNRIKSQVSQYPYIADSYFKGANPKNSYKTKLPYVLSFSKNPYSGNISSGVFKIFVKSYGADSPRPIKLKRNSKGYWKADEWSSIIMGITKPQVIVDDDL